MGKKDLFKFPSKKTLEYILIGILFVAVLSCTMKMMNISLNNILEGFDCEQRDVEAATCTRLPGDTPATAKHFIGDSGMSNLTTAVSGNLNINFLKGGSRNEVVINISNTDGQTMDVATLLSNLTDSIASSGIGSEVIVFKPSTDNKLNILTLPDSEITDIRMRYVATNIAEQATEVGNLQRVLGVNDFSSLNVSDKETCEQYFTLLEGKYDPRTNAEANAKLTLGSTQKCLTGCETESLGECPSDGVNSGCALNADSDTCECGGSTGLGSFVRNSGYNFDDNDVDNCLKSQITDIYSSDGTLGTRPGGWTTDGTGDVCSPRRPCLDNQEAYLNIIRKSSTSDTPSENCNPDNDYGDNEMRLNFCQPFGEAATFAKCNKHNNQTDCETEGSETDNTQCTWNPYCLSQEGLDKVIGGVQTDGDRLTCQGINDHQSCNAASECYWDWILAEELNGFRESDNKITEDTPKIEQLKDPDLFTTYLSNCKKNGGMLDNSKCSFYSAIQTLNSTDNRAKGYCRKEDCDYDKKTEHSLCSYCSTFALEDNTPSIVPEKISNFVEGIREMTGTSNSQSQQATPNQCYQIFGR